MADAGATDEKHNLLLQRPHLRSALRISVFLCQWTDHPGMSAIEGSASHSALSISADAVEFLPDCPTALRADRCTLVDVAHAIASPAVAGSYPGMLAGLPLGAAL